MYGKTASKEAESRQEQCSTELGQQLEVTLPTGLPNIVQRNCSLQICYSVTFSSEAAADKVVSALPERLLGSGWSSVHRIHAEIAQRSLPAKTLGISLFCYTFSSQYPKLLAPYPSASSISSGLTVWPWTRLKRTCM